MANLYQTICEFIPENARVLDLGCGDGTLLALLKTQKNIKGYGVEIDIDAVQSCLKKGLNVFHGDIEESLTGFSNFSYDYVILAHTLQQVRNISAALDEVLRVGQRAIVTFPNFGFWAIRWEILKGKLPTTKALPYSWYDTPNIRVITIHDFKALCQEKGIRIVEEFSYLETPLLRRLFGTKWTNLFTKKGMFMIERTHEL